MVGYTTVASSARHHSLPTRITSVQVQPATAGIDLESQHYVPPPSNALYSDAKYEKHRSLVGGNRRQHAAQSTSLLRSLSEGLFHAQRYRLPFVPSYYQRFCKLTLAAIFLLTLFYQFTSFIQLQQLVLPSAAGHPLVHKQRTRSSSTLIRQRLDTDTQWSNLTHLIIVAGHAILHSTLNDVTQLNNPDNWYLQSYQHDQLQAMLQHIERGVIEAYNDPSALLLFSGGETRSQAGPQTEAQSYYRVAELQNWYGTNADRSDINSLQQQNTRWRTLTEENASDSYENLLYSICRFRELTSHYPQHITVIGFEFKRRRFTQLHRNALRYPAQHFTYIGIDPQQMHDDPAYKQSIEQSELQHGYQPFTSNLYACNTELLSKKHQRNPYKRHHSYADTCSEIADLFAWCGGKTGSEVYPLSLPWDAVQQQIT